MPEKPKAERNEEPAPERTPPARLPLDRTKPPRQWRSRAYEPKQESSPEGAPSRTKRGRPMAEETVSAPPPAPPEPAGPIATQVTAEYAVAQPPPARAPDAPELPQRYGLDRLVLLVRDPYWGYAWWELTQERLHAGRRQLGEPAPVVVRFYDVSEIDWDGSNHHHSFDIEVQDTAGNWFVELGRPGATWIAELGVRAADGRFLALVRSNAVTLPRDGMSSVVDEEWMVLEEEYRKLFALSGGEAIGLGSAEILRWLEERLRRELLGGGISSFGVSSLGVSSLSMQRKQ